MADTREPGGAGRAPIEPIAGDRDRNASGMGNAQPVKVDMGQGMAPMPARRPESRSAMTNGAVLATSAVLALLFGGAGAWAYERFLALAVAGLTTGAAPTRGGNANLPGDLARLNDRVKILSEQCDRLSDQNKQLQQRMDSLTKTSRPPDLASIEEKVARIGQISQQVEAIGKQVDPLHEQLVQYEKKVTDLDAKLDEHRREVSGTHEPPSSGRGPEDRSSGNEGTPTVGRNTGPVAESETAENATGPGLESGISLFREKRYSEAYTIFRRLLQSRQDDARLWYYAALAYGLASNDWGRMTQSMAEEGVFHEKAGQPRRSVIDSAFAGLSRATGKEWLASYRQRAR
jgi:TolA-binding protein